jgi:hypothetical protein
MLLSFPCVHYDALFYFAGSKGLTGLMDRARTLRAYLRRKSREIAYLERRLVRRAQPTIARTGDHMLRRKMRARNRLLTASVRERSFNETNFDPTVPIDVAGLKLTYAYQRFRVEIHSPVALAAAYPGLRGANASPSSWGTFTSCGQSACTAFLLSLARVFRSRFDLFFWSGKYFEEDLVLKRLGSRNVRVVDCVSRLRSDVRCGYLDSSTDAIAYKSDLKKLIEHCQLVAVDTTCYGARSDRLAFIVSHTLRAGKPCILLRSHLKLDCLGMEYARLGSLVIASPRRATLATTRLLEMLRKETAQILSLIGGYASASQLYPFLADPTFQRISDERLDRIRLANRRVVSWVECALNELKERPLVMRFVHQIFFMIVFPKARKGVDGHDLLDALKRSGIPAQWAASFGFDFTAIQQFKGPQELSVRIAVGDHPDDLVGKSAGIIIEWIRGIRGLSKAKDFE